VSVFGPELPEDKPIWNIPNEYRELKSRLAATEELLRQAELALDLLSGELAFKAQMELIGPYGLAKKVLQDIQAYRRGKP